MRIWIYGGNEYLELCAHQWIADLRVRAGQSEGSHRRRSHLLDRVFPVWDWVHRYRGTCGIFLPRRDTRCQNQQFQHYLGYRGYLMRARLAVLGVGLLVGSACGGSSDVDAEPGQRSPAASADTQIGDSVTFEEYEERAFALKSCVEEKGYQLLGFELDPETRIYSYGYPENSLAVHDECYVAEFEDADMLWQSHQREVLGLDDELRAHFVACLKELDIEYQEDAGNGELGNLVLQADSGSDCLGRKMATE